MIMININNSKFEISAVAEKQYPATELPDIAFIGRSNVGKSTLINSLLNRKKIARVSARPGKTQLINFFNIDEKLYFVDLPGYGYAKVSKQSKEAWGKMIEKYLIGRKQLKLLVLLVDIRHAPSADDKIMLNWLNEVGANYIIVATKSDKLAKTKVKARVEQLKKEFEFEGKLRIIPFSSETKQGKDELWSEIESVISE